MSHDIYDQRFYSLRELPWHGLGFVSQEEMNAVQAFEKVGHFGVEVQPVYYYVTEKLVSDDPNSLSTVGRYHEITKRKAIMNMKENVVLSVVSEDYGVITPAMFCETWDKVVQRPIETLGCLGKGERMFITTSLPPFDINGDEIRSYLMAVNYLTGRDADELIISNVRTVCANTLAAAKSAARQKFTIKHDQAVVRRFENWLTYAWLRATEQSQALQLAYTHMANYSSLKVDQVHEVLLALYPLPVFDPSDYAGLNKEELDLRVRSEERREEAVKTIHNAILNLMEGQGRGWDTRAARGTAFGLYNAIVEFEDWGRRVRGVASAVNESVLFGARADKKEQAYSVILDLCLNN